MSTVSPILRRAHGRYFHWCPACEEMHPLPDGWTFNDDVNAPTFSPSFRQTFCRFEGEPGSTQARETKRDLICHYFITAGQIQFLADSWHGRSDTVDMPPVPDDIIC